MRFIGNPPFDSLYGLVDYRWVRHHVEYLFREWIIGLLDDVVGNVPESGDPLPVLDQPDEGIFAKIPM
jgi:hypothetical protein